MMASIGIVADKIARRIQNDEADSLQIQPCQSLHLHLRYLFEVTRSFGVNARSIDPWIYVLDRVDYAEDRNWKQRWK